MERSPYPTSGRRGCQCKDGTYSSKCCDGESQGIGGLTGGSVSSYTFIDGSEDVTNINGLIDLSCNNINLEGFSITDQGVITSPTTNVGTITSISPASFDAVTIDTPRTLSVTITVPSGYSNTDESIICTTTAVQSAPVIADLTCNDVTLTGFSVAINGSITLPTVDIGTISSTSPASFSIVNVDTLRTLSVDITVPSGYGNEGGTITCTATATQPLTPTLACSDITFTGFAVSYDGVITLPTIDIGTISATSPASFSDPEVDTLRTLFVDVTVPSGYYNAGSTLACSTTAIQAGVATALACEDLVFTGLAVDFIGNITTPTVNIGTVSSISPTTFARSPVFTPTSRTVTINVTVPSGYTNSGQTLACSQTVSQEVAKTFWTKDASNIGSLTQAYPYLTTSAACNQSLGINSGYLQVVHNGDNNIPVMTDDFYAYRNNSWTNFPKTINGVTDFPNVQTLSYQVSQYTYVYNACILQDPSTLTGFITADFYLEHTYGTNPGIGMTAIGTCP